MPTTKLQKSTTTTASTTTMTTQPLQTSTDIVLLSSKRQSQSQFPMRRRLSTINNSAGAEIVRQLLIMPPTTKTTSTTKSPTTAMKKSLSHSNLRKSQSTPAFKFDDVSVSMNVNNINNNNNKCKVASIIAVTTTTTAVNKSEATTATTAKIAFSVHDGGGGVSLETATNNCDNFSASEQSQQHLSAVTHSNNSNDNKNACMDMQKSILSINATSTSASTTITTTTLLEQHRFGCAHYKRRAMFVTPCCNKFYKCRFCHDENETHHFDRKTLTELICSECHTRQKVQEQCEKCGVRFGKYTCLICNLFDDSDKQQYHCHGCGICRIGGSQNFFHCEVCNMCLPIQLKIDGHRCVENISRSHCPVCLGDIHTSRIPCHIPDCGHLLHKMCFDQLLASGHYTCPTCQTSLIDMTALWEYLDAEALRMPIPLKYENQRVHIFCNDCHKTSKTKFHYIGLKCRHCGAYNTTQDVKRRMSLVTDEPSSA